MAAPSADSGSALRGVLTYCASEEGPGAPWVVAAAGGGDVCVTRAGC